ncbi:MAG TPA: LytTR family DNA-binding domain-containing protein, partial [Kofleriaceae bacterium]|nr:LytTR family DNA-binding domain-containing protein [Kofleriaceae bacterium]
AGPAAPPPPDLRSLVELVRGARSPARIATRLGDRVTLHDLDRVSHVRASDRATYAVVDGVEHLLDETLSALERRLDPARFFRIHRNTLVQLEFVAELVSDAAGVQVRLRDGTELAVARDRVRPLKDRLGI